MMGLWTGKSQLGFRRLARILADFVWRSYSIKASLCLPNLKSTTRHPVAELMFSLSLKHLLSDGFAQKNCATTRQALHTWMSKLSQWWHRCTHRLLVHCPKEVPWQARYASWDEGRACEWFRASWTHWLTHNQCQGNIAHLITNTKQGMNLNWTQRSFRTSLVFTGAGMITSEIRGVRSTFSLWEQETKMNATLLRLRLRIPLVLIRPSPQLSLGFTS